MRKGSQTFLFRGLYDSPRTPVRRTVFTGTGRTVELCGADIAVIGERINPTGKKKLKEALRTGDDAYVISEAISQAEAGADLLDVNAGLPELDEPAVLRRLIGAIQAVTPLPLQIDSADPAAIEAALDPLPEQLGMGKGKVFQPIRVAVVGSAASPGIGETLALAGKEHVLARIERAKELAA